MLQRTSATFALTALALIAFALNSILTRLALGRAQIDAPTFTALRLASGAVVLSILVRARLGSFAWLRGGVVGPLALLAYAAPFSFAYLRVGAAVGALVLFGVVQLTMVGYGIARGERPSLRAWFGLALACGGLAWLTLRSATRPDPLGIALMTIAGVAWGAYSLLGRRAPDALAANARSFVWSTPLAALLCCVLPASGAITRAGVLWALLSGGVTSGLGYAIWYRALRRLGVTQAAVAQLSVPVLAALGAVLVLGEQLSARLVLSGAAVLAGVGLVLSGTARRASAGREPRA